jgi:hypothetical protein
MAGGEEFYVGYAPRAPRGVATRVRRTVVLLFAVAIVTAVLLVAGQGAFDPGTFEYGVAREFEGTIRERPYPVLDVVRPGTAEGIPAASSYLLVAFGKRGASAITGGLDGRPVRLRGSLVHRGGMTMIEVAEGSVEPLAGDAAARSTAASPAPEILGRWTLAGEIVDSKCFLGVMKPGRLKPHRACAARCISGGIPPVLAVIDAAGNAAYYVLASASGDPVNRDVLDLVAEPVEISGIVVRRGDLLFLHADPSSYRRL